MSYTVHLHSVHSATALYSTLCFYLTRAHVDVLPCSSLACHDMSHWTPVWLIPICHGVHWLKSLNTPWAHKPYNKHSVSGGGDDGGDKEKSALMFHSNDNFMTAWLTETALSMRRVARFCWAASCVYTVWRTFWLGFIFTCCCFGPAELKFMPELELEEKGLILQVQSKPQSIIKRGLSFVLSQR